MKTVLIKHDKYFMHFNCRIFYLMNIIKSFKLFCMQLNITAYHKVTYRYLCSEQHSCNWLLIQKSKKQTDMSHIYTHIISYTKKYTFITITKT